MSEAVLEVRDLRKSYEDGRIQALRGVDLRVDAREFVAITGPSGSGKSTLLQMLGGLDTPTSGEVLFRGANIGREIDLDTYRSKNVGFVFQAFYLLPSLRAIENVQVPMLPSGAGREARAERAHALLCELGLKDRLLHYPNQLSAGERQRVAIARSLANRPEILLADEPTGNLDSENSAKTIELLAQLRETHGMTLIIVTHEPEVARSAPRHIQIRDGRVVQ
jgi:putative ABC transport system ATP-binding protein